MFLALVHSRMTDNIGHIIWMRHLDIKESAQMHSVVHKQIFQVLVPVAFKSFRLMGVKWALSGVDFFN